MFACLLRVAVTESVNRGENLKRRDISTDKDNIIFIPNGKLFNYRSICQGSVLHIRMRINDLCINTINPMQNCEVRGRITYVIRHDAGYDRHPLYHVSISLTLEGQRSVLSMMTPSCL